MMAGLEIKDIRTVDLDLIVDTASRYRRLREPLWPIIGVDRSSGLHGEGAIFHEDAVRTAVRTWRSFTAIVGSGDNDSIPVVRFTNVPAARQRGYVRIPGTAISIEYLAPDRALGQFMVAWQQSRWLVVGQKGRQLKPGREDQYLSGVARCALGLTFQHEYLWSAVFTMQNHAPFCIPTSARGALALFKLRDKPDAGGRRPALHHWVAEHYRKTRLAEEEVGVREHLRGKQTFTWSGINVELRPSPYDQERARLATSPTR